MQVVRYVKTVLWSFIGIGRRSDMAQMHKSGNPLALILVALVLVVLLVAGMIALARFAASVA